MKKERPILFNTEMVQAILEGRKTQTRRTKGLDKLNSDSLNYVYTHNSNEGEVTYPAIKYNFAPWYSFHPEKSNETTWVLQCPYGQVGDILWVRETWQQDGDDFFYRADDYINIVGWKPSIHMPKKACRLKLEIVSLTVERLQDISEKDSACEGVLRYHDTEFYVRYGSENDWCANARASFAYLWESINGKQSWDANPWVWRIEFKVVQHVIN